MTKSIPISQLKRHEQPAHEDDVDSINNVLQSLETYEDDEDDMSARRRPPADKYDETFVQDMKPEDMIQKWLFQTSDLKDAIYVFAIFILIVKIPLEKIIYKYISLEHIPLSDVFIKATMAAILFFIVRKLF